MSNACLGVRIIGPLAPHADGFRSWLSRQWYATVTAAEQLRLMAHVSRWMASQKLDCAGLPMRSQERSFERGEQRGIANGYR
jgi:hypothetical protein